MKTLHDVLPPMADGRPRFGATPVLWSARQPVPAIGDRVTSHCGVGLVSSYFFADGGPSFYLGVVVTLTEPADWWTKQNGAEREARLFGAEIRTAGRETS